MLITFDLETAQFGDPGQDVFAGFFVSSWHLWRMERAKIMTRHSLVFRDAPRLIFHDAEATDDLGFRSPPYQTVSHLWPERGLCIANDQDLVVTNKAVDPDYLAYFAEITNQSPSLLVLDADESLTQSLILGAHKIDHWLTSQSRREGQRIDLSPMILTNKTHELGTSLSGQFPDFEWSYPEQKSIDAVQFVNLKSNISNWLPKSGLKSTPVCAVHERQDSASCLWEHLKPRLQSQSLIVKADFSSSGVGNKIINNSSQEELMSWLEGQTGVDTFVVEELVDFVFSPNVQFYIDHTGACHFVGWSDQILNDGLQFKGNSWPLPDSHSEPLLDAGWLIARKLSKLGVRHIVGIDFLCLEDGSIRFVEVNARFNGSTYAQSIVEKLNADRLHANLDPVGAWSQLRIFPDKVLSFVDLHKVASDLLFSRRQDAGVIPYLPSLFTCGIANVVAVGSTPEQVKDLEQEFCSRLSSAWVRR